jgi:hypothetical protein
MLGYTTKNACRTRMNIIAMTVGLTGGTDDLTMHKTSSICFGVRTIPCIHLQMFITKKIAIFLIGQLH